MRPYTSILLLCLLTMSLSGQSWTGVVLDNYGESMIGVNIVSTKTNSHTHSLTDGAFSLEGISQGDTIVFSHIGFTPLEWVVEEMDHITIRMQPAIISLEEIVISPTIDALQATSAIDVQKRPVNSSQDILQHVPGLFIGQHAGGGKAEQIFLRGFDIDHGTDIYLTVDEVPVNMVSHAHGQGYSDLHFIIPETIERIDFAKGPYDSSKGNFATAGYVHFKTRDKIDQSQLKFELGDFNYKRISTLLDLVSQKNQNVYLAAEHIRSDGPFESEQNFRRSNIFGTYNLSLRDNSKIRIKASHFRSRWDASGQIPQRAVDSGEISRLGAIDDTEGGFTDRTNVSISYHKALSPDSYFTNSLFFSNYNFELYSNFTFFLEDPLNGDQIRQKENRNIFGFNTSYNRNIDWNNGNGLLSGGFSFRNDIVNDVELSRTANRRTTIRPIQLGDINELNMGAYVDLKMTFGNWNINPSIRVDFIEFQYTDELTLNYTSSSEGETILSPKLNIRYNYNSNLQLYLKSGKGFHSNDSRSIIVDGIDNKIPSAWGLDLGAIWKPHPKILINATYWNLYLAQEFVYVGDEGIVEPSGRTERNGIDLGVRFQPIKPLYWNFDLNFNNAKSIDEPEDANYIPLAPRFTLASGLNLAMSSGVYAGVNLRVMGDRAATEDNALIAKGYSVVDLNIGREWKNIGVSLAIQNLLNTEWNETQFATTSRLQNEPSPIEEIHFTPGTPLFIKGSVIYRM